LIEAPHVPENAVKLPIARHAAIVEQRNFNRPTGFLGGRSGVIRQRLALASANCREDAGELSECFSERRQQDCGLAGQAVAGAAGPASAL